MSCCPTTVKLRSDYRTYFQALHQKPMTDRDSARRISYWLRGPIRRHRGLAPLAGPLREEIDYMMRLEELRSECTRQALALILPGNRRSTTHGWTRCFYYIFVRYGHDVLLLRDDKLVSEYKRLNDRSDRLEDYRVQWEKVHDKACPREAVIHGAVHDTCCALINQDQRTLDLNAVPPYREASHRILYTDTIRKHRSLCEKIVSELMS